MKESYTARKDETVWDFVDKLDEKDTHEEIIEYLREGKIRSFGDGLAYLINEKDKDANITSDNLQNYLEEKCEKNGIVLKEIDSSRNTFKNWFGNTRPRKEAKNREIMFKIAFALELNIEEVKYLFHKVYFDRAFDYRNYREAVYYYCIVNGYNYERANKIINEIEKKVDKTSVQKRHSLSIANEIGKIKNDDELVDWICSRWREFQFNNKAAMEKFKVLFEEAQKLAQEKGSKELELKEEKKKEKINIHKESDKFIYYVMFGELPGAKETYFPIIKSGSHIYKELKTNFPTTNYINDFCKRIGSEFKSQGYNKLRKIIILFKFYCFFENVKRNDKKNKFDYQEEFIAEMNDLLDECGLCELYPANPYDFLFILCAGDDTPLDCLRIVIYELRDEQNE